MPSLGLGQLAQPGTTGLSVAAAAVIAHEVGHAAQDAQRDPFMALRQLVVPVAQIGSTIAPWLIIAGVFMRFTNLAVVGLVFFAAAVAFTFVTLPVEMGASKRAAGARRSHSGSSGSGPTAFDPSSAPPAGLTLPAR